MKNEECPDCYRDIKIPRHLSFLTVNFGVVFVKKKRFETIILKINEHEKKYFSFGFC